MRLVAHDSVRNPHYCIAATVCAENVDSLARKIEVAVPNNRVMPSSQSSMQQSSAQFCPGGVTEVCHGPAQDAEGWQVLMAGMTRAKEVLGTRILSAYAMGSLAHGGFVPTVSDVDLALLLDRVTPADETTMQSIREHVARQLRSPLAQRLSLFWESFQGLRTGTFAGRFPLIDRTDLVAHGICLHGPDQRSAVYLPTGQQLHEQLLIECACFMLDKLATPQRCALLKEPDQLLQLGCRELSKIVLYPLRLLNTVDSGKCASNGEAVVTALGCSDAERELADAALHWRSSGKLVADATARAQLAAGLLPLYRRLISTYRSALASMGLHALVQDLDDWYSALASDQAETTGGVAV